MISQLTSNALKGQQQLAQGSALGEEESEKDALKVQKHYKIQALFPNAFAPVGRWFAVSLLPRVMPWAMSGLALQAALTIS